MKDKKLIIAFINNIVIVVFTIFALIVMLSDFKFMHMPETIAESTPIGRFRFFTIDSNILMAITSLVFLIQQYKLMNNKIKEIDKKYYVLLLVATTSVALTFTIVLCYLGQLTPKGLLSMYTNKNFFFHGLIPLIAMINFIFFEKTNKINMKHNILVLLPVLLYGIYYTINILIHIDNGVVSHEYDWYYFLAGSLSNLFIVVPLIFALTYLLGFILYKLNKLRLGK